MAKKIRLCFTGKDLEELFIFLEGEGFHISENAYEHLRSLTFTRDSDGYLGFGSSRRYDYFLKVKSSGAGAGAKERKLW